MTLPGCYEYVRRYYAVPAHVGVAVLYGDKKGRIVGKRSTQQYIYVRFDGATHAVPIHPQEPGLAYHPELP